MRYGNACKRPTSFISYRGLGRESVISKHLEVAQETFKPVYLRDPTRTRVFEVAIPFIRKLTKLLCKYMIPFKVRVCDNPCIRQPGNAEAKRGSVPKLISS